MPWWRLGPSEPASARICSSDGCPPGTVGQLGGRPAMNCCRPQQNPSFPHVLSSPGTCVQAGTQPLEGRLAWRAQGRLGHALVWRPCFLQ